MTRTIQTLIAAILIAGTAAHAHAQTRQSEMDKGDILRLAGHSAAAADAYRNAVQFAQQPGGNPLALAAALNSLAVMENESGLPSEAKLNFERALAVSQAAAGRHSVAFAQVLVNYSGAYVQQAQYAKAEKQLREAIATYSDLVPSDAILLAVARNGLGETLLWERALPEAALVLNQACAILKKEPAPRHGNYGMCLNNLGMVRQLEGRDDEAIRLLTEALSVLESERGMDNPMLLNSLNNLAVAKFRAGDIPESAKFFSRALQIANTNQGPSTPVQTAILSNYAQCLRKLGRKSEAKKLESQVEIATKDRARTTGAGYTVDVTALRPK